MDPVSIALITAIGAGITESITDATKTSLAAGYMALKKRLLEKISSRHPKVSQALTELEVTPTSLARQAVLVEEITAAQIPKDAELMALAQKLLSQVQQIPSGSQIISHVQNSAVSNSGTAITYNIQVLQLIPVAEISCEQAILPVLRCWHA
jgi:hypothetical protein